MTFTLKIFLAALLIILLLSGSIYVTEKVLKIKSPLLDLANALLDVVKNDESTVAGNLNIPWEIAFLPNGNILITERPGKLVLLDDNKKIIEVKGVEHIGEGGLLGMALHPEFNKNHFVYLYLTTKVNGELMNEVRRYKLEGNSLSEEKTILSGILGSKGHDGGRIKFGPDGMLYATTGDALHENLSQDTTSLNGKILRIKDNGSIPSDNPFGNAVYSYGHRNVQGLAWDTRGNLWATEHGRSFPKSGLDELNVIKKGANYGWPIIQGDEKKKGMISPVINSGPYETWAPAGAAYLNGRVYFTGLRGKALYEVGISSKQLTSFKKRLEGEYGRLRSVTVGPDGMLYLTTSNRDGRGNPVVNDDKLIKINPSALR